MSSAADSLAPAPPQGSDSADSIQASPGAADDGKGACSPAQASHCSQRDRRTSSDQALRRDSQGQSAVPTPGIGSIGCSASPDYSRRESQSRDPNEGIDSRRRTRSGSRRRRKHRDYHRGSGIGSVNASPVTGSPPHMFSDARAGAAASLPISPADVGLVGSDEYTKKSTEATVSSPAIKKKRLRASSIRVQRHRNSHKQEPPDNPKSLCQKDKVIAPEMFQAKSHSREIHPSGRRAKHRIMHLGWRFRKKGSPKPEAPLTVIPPRRPKEAEGAEVTSLKRLPSTAQSVQTPAVISAESDRHSVALPLSPPSPGHSSKSSWSSLFNTPTSPFWSQIRRLSKYSPSTEEPVTERLERLTTVPEIQWACDEPSSGRRSPESARALSSLKANKAGKRVYFGGDRDVTYLLQKPGDPLKATPWDVRTSKLPRFWNLNDANVCNSHRRKWLSIMAIASAMILAAMLTVVAVLRNSARYRRALLIDHNEDFKMCSAGAEMAKADCLAAMQQLSYDMDWSANPCSNLDQFVCGHWRRWDTRRLSHRRENVVNMTARIHDSFLDLLQNLHLYGHEEGGMAVFYNSCRSFVAGSKDRRTSVAAVISALDLHRRMEALNDSTGVQGLMDFVVETSLSTGLPTVISVSSRAGTIYVDKGRSIWSLVGSAEVEPFLADVLRSMGTHNKSLGPIRDIDDAVHRHIREEDTEEPFVNTTVGVLGERAGFGDSFVDALNRALPYGVPVHTVNTRVALRSLEEIQAALATLATANLRMAYVYTSAVLLAQVMRYAYKFRHGANLPGYEVTRSCVRITGEHFKALFPHWVTKQLVGQSQLASFRAMTKTLRQAFARSDTATELGLSDRDLSAVKIIVVGERSVTAWSRDAPPGTTPTNYDHDFLLNVLRASRDGVNTDYDDHAVERHMNGEITVGEVDQQRAVFVPADFFLADMFYASSGPQVNFPTTGVWLLVQWISAVVLSKQTKDFPTTNVSEQKIWKTRGRDKERDVITGRTLVNSQDNVEDARRDDMAYAVGAKTECVARDASSALGRNVSEQEGTLLFLANWALDVAFLGVEETHPALPSSWWKDEQRIWQLFLLRFCRSLCGDEAGLDSCRYQPLRSRQFAKAFHCTEPPPAGC